VLSWSDPITGAELQGPIRRARVPGFESDVLGTEVRLGPVRDRRERCTDNYPSRQEEAVGQALQYMESVACRGRKGAGGLAEGFAAAGSSRPRSSTGRRGPAIRSSHTHVLVANAIQRPDGQWGGARRAPDLRAHQDRRLHPRGRLPARAGARPRRPVGAIGEASRTFEASRRRCSTRSADGATRSTTTRASAGRAARRQRRGRSRQCGRARLRTTASRARSCCLSGVSAQRPLDSPRSERRDCFEECSLSGGHRSTTTGCWRSWPAATGSRAARRPKLSAVAVATPA
jgi:hypothetical protein